jgi:hypothetical protein
MALELARILVTPDALKSRAMGGSTPASGTTS